MGLLNFLDVLLGLVFVYMLFALIASGINEAIASVLNSRSEWLKIGLKRLLGKDSARILASPHLLFSRGRPSGEANETSDPSYLRAADFLRALLSDEKVLAEWNMAAIIERINKMLDSPIKRILLDLAVAAKADVAAFEKAFADWFDGFELTVRSWYRRKTHWVLLAISLGIAVSINVDSIALMRHLSTNAETRNALADRAIVATTADGADALASSRAIKQADDRLKELRAADSPDSAAITAAQKQLSQAFRGFRQDILDQIDMLEVTGLPLGWRPESFTSAKDWSGQFWRDWLWALFLALPGLMISAFAFTLGAPFWFDMLKRIASIRSVGKTPDESKDAKDARQTV